MGVPIKPEATKEIKVNPPARRIRLSAHSKILLLLVSIIGICLIAATIIVVIRSKGTIDPKLPPPVDAATTEIYSKTFIIIITDNDTEKNSTIEQTDLTSDKIAAALLSTMNISVSPCDDFCKFTGGEGQAIDLRNHQSSARATRKLREIFAEESPADELQSLTHVKNLYRACVKQDPTKAPNLDRLKMILNVLGGWPVVEGDSWSAENVSWRDLQIKLSGMGFEGFFKTFYSHRKNAMILAPIDRSFSLDNYRQWIIFKQKLVDMAVEMGAERNRAKWEMEQALSFDLGLPEFQIENDTLVKHVDLHYLVNSLNISESEVISLFPPHFDLRQHSLHLSREKMIELVNLLNATPTRVIFNHALMRFIANLTPFSSDPAERQEQCIDFIAARLPEAQEILYIRKYFHKNTKNHVNELIQNLKNTMKKQCEEFNNGISTRIYEAYASCSAIDHTSISLGYPDEFFDDKKITEYYKNLEIYPENFLQGLLNYTRYRINSDGRKSLDFRRNLRGYVAPNSNIVQNSLPYVPAEYLYTYFVENMPKYRIYGEFVPLLGQMMSLGVISHDSRIMNYENDRVRAKELMFHIPRVLRFSSVSTWGTEGAYLLYKNWLKINGQEPSPTKLTNYTSEQMFWISRSHFHCNGNSRFQKTIANYENLKSDFKCSEKKKL